jgi:hypothetical protein
MHMDARRATVSLTATASGRQSAGLLAFSGPSNVTSGHMSVTSSHCHGRYVGGLLC